MTTKARQHRCAVCGNVFTSRALVRGTLVRDPIAELIRRDHPDWSEDHYICQKDLKQYRVDYVHAILTSEKGEITALERQVLESLHKHEILSENVDAEFEEGWSLGERLADKIAAFGGSWLFLILFGMFVLGWMIANSVAVLWRPADPYPYIFLNLMLSCLAAIQAPVIMMSQNRQEAKDRMRSRHDYQVNLKAELEIRQLHEKIDHLLSHQWDRLIQIQELQIDLLSELRQRK